MAEAEDGRIVGVATLALRYQLGLGGIIASLDELAIAENAPRGVERRLKRETLGKARGLGAVRVLKQANQHTPPPRAALDRTITTTASGLPSTSATPTP